MFHKGKNSRYGRETNIVEAKIVLTVWMKNILKLLISTLMLLDLQKSQQQHNQ